VIRAGSWKDVENHLQVSARTSEKQYRKPTEKEWEEAARDLKDTLKKTIAFSPPTYVVSSDSPDFSVRLSNSALQPDKEIMAAEFEKITNQQILYNGQQVTVKDLNELLKKDINGKVKLTYVCYFNKDKKIDQCKVLIDGRAIDPKDPAYFYVANGKWVYSISITPNLVHEINVYAPAEAVKKYGSKAKNGAISYTCTEPVIVRDYSSAEAKSDKPDKK